MRTNLKTLSAASAAAAAAVSVALAVSATPVSAASSADDAMAATQDLFVKMSARDLAGVSRYIPVEGFTETVPETDKLLQLNAKAFAGLFQSGKKISLRAVDMQATVLGDAVIVTGKRVGYVAAPDATTPPTDGRLAFSMVWSKQSDAWQLRHIHLSTLPGAKP